MGGSPGEELDLAELHDGSQLRLRPPRGLRFARLAFPSGLRRLAIAQVVVCPPFEVERGQAQILVFGTDSVSDRSSDAEGRCRVTAHERGAPRRDAHRKRKLTFRRHPFDDLFRELGPAHLDGTRRHPFLA